MDVDRTFRAILTGTPPVAGDPFTEAVAERFKIIRGAHEFHLRRGEYCYNGNRTHPDSLGWRARQSHGEATPESVKAGEYDAQIALTYHEAASIEFYYRYEKDWG